MGERRIERIETITVRDLPDEFSGADDAKGVHHVVTYRFVELGPAETRWDRENPFHISGLMKVIGLLMKGAFPKQSLKYTQDFKAFAERGVDVGAAR